MSGHSSSAFSMDLSNRDFRAMIVYDFLGGKSYQECFLGLPICFGDKPPVTIHCDQMVQKISVWMTDAR